LGVHGGVVGVEGQGVEGEGVKGEGVKGGREVAEAPAERDAGKDGEMQVVWQRSEPLHGAIAKGMTCRLQV